MKKALIRILAIASVVTSIGYIMDGDPKEPIMAMRLVEFFAMIGILFVFFSIVYYASTFAFKKINSLIALKN